MISASVIAIGDEILYGQTLNTNAHWISQQLDNVGINVLSHHVIGDNHLDIVKALKSIDTTVTIITGGLGPTSDDITKVELAKFFNTSLEIHNPTLEFITNFFKNKGLKMTATNEEQAMLPKHCTILPNSHGTAPGMWFEKDDKIVISLPGIPYEMKSLIKEQTLPLLKKRLNLENIFHRVVKVVGIGESWLSDKIHKWESELPANVGLAYLPSFGEIKLRLTTKGEDSQNNQRVVDDCIKSLVPIIDDYIYGYDEDTLVSRIGNLLVEKKMHLSIAESCTGGYVSHKITTQPGASNFFQGSVIAYGNSIKKSICGVSDEDINKYGAVSKTVVNKMAYGVAKKFKTQIGIATSGIAGPGGGTRDKPVGIIYISLCCLHFNKKKENFAPFYLYKKLSLGNLREENIKRATTALLELLWRFLNKENRLKINNIN